MPVDLEISRQAARLGEIFMKADDSDIMDLADELLLFLNRLQDHIKQNPIIQFPLSSISDIIYRLESNPDITLQDQEIRSRLLKVFAKLAVR